MENYFMPTYGKHGSTDVRCHTKIDKEAQPYQNKLPQILLNHKLYLPISLNMPGLQ